MLVSALLPSDTLTIKENPVAPVNIPRDPRREEYTIYTALAPGAGLRCERIRGTRPHPTTQN